MHISHLHHYLHHYWIGVRVTYECKAGYKAVDATELECLTTGYWSDYPPKCLAKGWL